MFKNLINEICWEHRKKNESTETKERSKITNIKFESYVHVADLLYHLNGSYHQRLTDFQSMRMFIKLNITHQVLNSILLLINEIQNAYKR